MKGMLPVAYRQRAMNVLPRWFLLLFFASVLSACVTHQNAPADAVELPESGFRVIAGQTYTPADWPQELHADIYLPQQEGAKPAVLLVHGGGWERRSPEDLVFVAETLAEAGFVVFNVAYRFAPQHQFPAQLHDLQVAMQWIHRHADQYQVDVQQIGAFGYSSGAHLVSLLGVVAGTGDALDQPHGGPLSRPAAVVAGGTPSDLRKFPAGRLVPQFLGGTLAEIPQVFAAASPVYHVHRGAPPFFLYHGTMDYLVPVDHATDFATTLEAHGVVVETYLMHLRGHVTAFLTSGHAVRAAARFLRSNMAPVDLATCVRTGSQGDRCVTGWLAGAGFRSERVALIR